MKLTDTITENGVVSKRLAVLLILLSTFPFSAVAQDDHGNSPETATRVVVGSITAGSLEEAGDRDYFEVTVSQRAVYYFFSRGSTDTSATLLDADHRILAVDYDGGETNQFRIAWALSPGTYYIEVRPGSSKLGAYDLHIEGPDGGTTSDDHGFSPWSATPTAIGTVTTGMFELAGDRDYFEITVSQRAVYYFYSRGNTDTTSTLIEVNDNVHNVLMGDDDGGETNQFRIAWALGPGTYYIEIRPGSSILGSYELHIEGPDAGTTSDDHGFSPWSATAVEIGTVTTGEFELVGDRDYFEVSVSQAAVYYFYSRGNTDTTATLIEVNDNVHNVLMGDDDGGETNQFRIAWALGPGTYYIEIRPGSSILGSYELHIEGPDAGTTSDDHGFSPWSATAVAGGLGTSGRIDVAGDLDYFRFEATELSTFDTYATGTTDTKGALFDAELNRLASDHSSGDQNNFKMSVELQPGIYYVEVGGDTATMTGDYAFRVDGPTVSFQLTGTAYCSATPPVAPAVLLEWTAWVGATSYVVYRDGSAHSGSLSASTLRFDDNANVDAGQTYTYFIRATNDSGSTDSNTIAATVPVDVCAGAVPPGAPSNLVAVASSSTEASLTWIDNSDNETGFKIERKTGTSGTYAQIGTQGTDSTFHSDSGLSASTEYCYRVRATNGAGDSDYSNESCATTQEAPQPPGAFTLTGTAYCNTTPPAAPAVLLEWTEASGATTYVVYRNSAAYSDSLPSTTLSFDNNANVDAGQAYSYFIRATNGNGAKDSNTISVTVPTDVCATTSFGGVVTDALNGAAIADASVTWASHTTTTDSSGGYFFSSVPCQSGTLSVTKNGYQTHTEDYSPSCVSSNQKDVVLIRSITISGQVSVGSAAVRGNSSDPSKKRTVTLISESDEPLVTVPLSAEGSYEIDTPPGVFRLFLEIEYVDFTYYELQDDPTLYSHERSIQATWPASEFSESARIDFRLDPPVVLLHGILSGPRKKWESWVTHLNAVRPSTAVFTPGYVDHWEYELEATQVLDQLLKGFGDLCHSVPRFRVIAHSKGGLVARVLASQYPTLIGPGLADVILLGTPNSGSQCFLEAVSDKWSLSPCAVKEKVNFLYPTFGSLPPSKVHAVAGTSSFLFGYSPCLDEARPHDGVVPVDSALVVRPPDGTSPVSPLEPTLIPVHHSQLGSAETAWFLTDFILPYYYEGTAFPSCPDEYETRLVECDKRAPAANSCWDGRGLTRDGVCNLPPGTGLFTANLISWESGSSSELLPPPINVAVSTIPSDPCVNAKDSPASANAENLLGYWVYRGTDPAAPLENWIRVGTTAGTQFVDYLDSFEGTLYYVVTAIYPDGESQPSEPAALRRSSRRRPIRRDW